MLPVPDSDGDAARASRRVSHLSACPGRSAAYDEFFLSRFRGICEELEGVGALPTESEEIAEETLACMFDLWVHIKNAHAWVHALAMTLYLRERWRDDYIPSLYGNSESDSRHARREPRTPAEQKRAWLQDFLADLSRAKRNRLFRVYGGLAVDDIAVLMDRGSLKIALALDAMYSEPVGIRRSTGWSGQETYGDR